MLDRHHPLTDLSFHIHQFVPAAEGEELESRITLLKARDYAAAMRSKTISRRAYDHACDAHEMAGEFVYADVPVLRLELAARYCRNLVVAAMLAEQLEGEGGEQ